MLAGRPPKRNRPTEKPFYDHQKPRHYRRGRARQSAGRIYIMVFFMAVGALDKCIGNKFGYGEKFEEGIMAMGALALLAAA